MSVISLYCGARLLNGLPCGRAVKLNVQRGGKGKFGMFLFFCRPAILASHVEGGPPRVYQWLQPITRKLASRHITRRFWRKRDDKHLNVVRKIGRA